MTPQVRAILEKLCAADRDALTAALRLTADEIGAADRQQQLLAECFEIVGVHNAQTLPQRLTQIVAGVGPDEPDVRRLVQLETMVAGNGTLLQLIDSIRREVLAARAQRRRRLTTEQLDTILDTYHVNGLVRYDEMPPDQKEWRRGLLRDGLAKVLP